MLCTLPQGTCCKILYQNDIEASSYTITEGDELVLVDYTITGIVTITLPVFRKGYKVIIKDSGGNAGTNNIIINTIGAQTIDGETNYTIIGDYDSVMLAFDGTNWVIL